MATSDAIPEMMTALQLVEYNKDYKLASIPVPVAGTGELLVRVAAASFCHTDLQVHQGVYESRFPMVPSHEPVGTIVRRGPNTDSKWEIGQRVGVLNFKHPCGTCRKCRWHKGEYGTLDARFCESKNMAGITTDGGFAEYLLADAATTVLLPEGLGFEQAAPLMCAGATVWNALSQCNLKPGQTVGIIGIGGLGILAVQFAKALGYQTVAVDNCLENLTLSSDTGPGLEPDLLVDYNDSEGTPKIWNFTDGLGLRAAVVCNDDVQAAEWSLKLLQPRGTCVPLGLPEKGYHFNAFDLVFNELVIKGSLCASRDSVEAMMKVVAKHGIKSHITAVALKDAAALPTKYKNRDFKGRLVVTMDK
ncbi:chaperonin 10-like protein [Leptodontidium sp. MPI-SDFR-AT-0119]|nr:chaperonin 10-like protein [Leptodontidium sp. MPI-SDFR-AT-0119]